MLSPARCQVNSKKSGTKTKRAVHFYTNLGIFQIPSESYFSGISVIICAVLELYFVPAVILRIAAPVGTEPLSGRNTGKYAGKVPVYAGGSDGCNQ